MPHLIGHGLGAAQKTDAQLLELYNRYRKESFDSRWVYERQWLRNLYYVLGRQWIYWDHRRGEWRDKRMAKWVPKPVTNKCSETEETISAMFASINIGANARPNGNDPKNVITAGIADEFEPILRTEHKMDSTMADFDFWLIVLGSAFLHTFLDKDLKYGTVTDPVEHCVQCGQVYTSSQIAEAQNTCPDCGSNEFEPMLDEVGAPRVNSLPKTRGRTTALSPLEIAFPLQYSAWDDLPYLFRLRWRDKLEYELHDELKEYVPRITWQKAPVERTMQIFRSLPLQNDLGVSNAYAGAGGASTESEGVSEYDLFIKPCDAYPEGYVVRFVGDQNPLVLHLESEGIPGPLPYHDAEGNPLFTFTRGIYRRVGGRIFGGSALDPIIQKQNSLNQLDSMVEMCAMRMANPVWLEPKGAEVEKFTGEPGLVVKWNPLVVGGQAKPERLEGANIPPGLFRIREQYLKDIEEATGTYDILKGAKPTGVEAFSALQLLVEKGQGRFAKTFKSRGEAYVDWFKFALELEREFGEESRTKALMTPTKGWIFQTFKNADLQGSISIEVEDGTNTPKTSLGRRAAIEHARQLGALNLQDPDQQYAVLSALGLTEFVPSLDVQVQAALQQQELFENWINDPQAIEATMAEAAMTPPDPSKPVGPLKWRRWYDPIVHRQEFIKWANSDRMRELMTENPDAEGLLDAYLMQIDLAIMVKAQGAMDVGAEMLTLDAPSSKPGDQKKGSPNDPNPQQQGAAGPPPGGAGQAMANSNQNSAPAGNTPQPAAA